MNILLVDTETTGLKPDISYILSNGSIIFNTVTGEKEEFYEVLDWDNLLTNFTIPEDTIKVHGITEKVMHDEGINPINSMSNYYNWIKSFCSKPEHLPKDNPSSNWKLDVVVAFNLSFDLNMFISNLKFLSEKIKLNNTSGIENNLNPIDIDNINSLLDLFLKEYMIGELNPNDPNLDKPLFIDSLIIDRIFNFEVDGEKVYHDLQTVGERYGIPEDVNAHNAIADTRRTYEVFKIQMKEIEEHNEHLNHKFENRLIKRYKKNQDYWKKGGNGLDYLANNMNAVRGGRLREQYI